MNKVLILGQARSGSTYFKNNLNRHDECFLLNEPLAPGIISPTTGTWTKNISARPHCGLDGPKGRSFISDKEWISCIKRLDESSNRYFNELWNTILRNTKGKCKNIGMKLFWNHNNTMHSKVYNQKNDIRLEKDWWLDKNFSENVIPKFNKFIILNRPIEETVFSRTKSMTTNLWGSRVRERTKNTYPTFQEFMDGLYNWSSGKIRNGKGNKDFVIKSQIKYHIGAESFSRYMESKYDSLSVDYNNINWDEVSDYLGMKIEDKFGYDKFEYNIERWLIENPEFKYICDRVKEELFQLQKQYTF
tara:strand:+ start:222 stop:1130 length:909 start_codon:yes stop_codon:yes gene_type:complete